MRAAFIVLSLATAAFAALMPRQSPAPPGCSYDECPLDLTARAPTGANNDGVSLMCNYDGTDLCIYSLVRPPPSLVPHAPCLCAAGD